MINETCPKCGSNVPQYSHGKNKKGHARYRCTKCKRTYTLEKPRYPEEFKQAAVNLYLEGNSSIAVSRIMGIGKNTIWYWLKKYNEKLPKIKESDTKVN